MTTTPQAALLSDAANLADEYRVTMPREVFAIWGAEAQAELRRLDALVAHLTADRDDTANELALRTKHNLALTNERDQLLAKLQATQEPVQSVPEAMKVVTEAVRSDPDYAWSWHCNVAMASVDEGMGHYEANQAAARFMHSLAGVDTTKHQGFPEAPKKEPVQAVELPALPHDGWPARFRCDSCDGNGEIGELISMGHFQPPERQTCPDCGGRGWSDEGPAFNADHMRDYARAVLSARKPLNSAQIRGMAIQEEFLLVCDSLEDLTCIVREVERAHGIGLEVKP